MYDTIWYDNDDMTIWQYDNDDELAKKIKNSQRANNQSTMHNKQAGISAIMLISMAKWSHIYRFLPIE